MTQAQQNVITPEQEALERKAWDEALATPESQEFLKEQSKKALEELNGEEDGDDLEEM